MSDSNKAVWFLVGLGVGAAAGLLLAPQSGEETREFLTRKAGEGKDLLQRKSDEVRDQATRFAERGKTVVTRQIDQFQAAVDAGRQAYRESAGLSGTENSGR